MAFLVYIVKYGDCWKLCYLDIVISEFNKMKPKFMFHGCVWYRCSIWGVLINLRSILHCDIKTDLSSCVIPFTSHSLLGMIIDIKTGYLSKYKNREFGLISWCKYFFLKNKHFFLKEKQLLGASGLCL
jgi:hypothetical protein